MLPVNFNLTIASSDVDTFIQLLDEGGFKTQGEAMQMQCDAFSKPLLRKITTEELQGLRVASYEYIDPKSKATPEEAKRNIHMQSKPKTCFACEYVCVDENCNPCNECLGYSNYKSRSV